MLFVLLRVLRLSNADPLLWQQSLTGMCQSLWVTIFDRQASWQVNN
jgi:hypothetical protein